MHSLVLVVGTDVHGSLDPHRRREWDWWEVGGRWENWLKLRAGGATNRALKREVNWDAMADASAAWAAKNFDTESAKFDALAAAAAAEEEAVAKGESACSSARDTYALTKEKYCDFDRDAYIAQMRRRSCVVAAIVVGTEWHQQEYRSKSPRNVIISNWCDKAASILSSLPDDAVLTVVDCHG